MSYTDDMKELIVTEYEAGTSIANIAKMTDKRYQSIRSAVRSKWYEELKAQLVESEVENESDEPDVLDEPEVNEVEEVGSDEQDGGHCDPPGHEGTPSDVDNYGSYKEVDPHNESDQDELESDFGNEDDEVDEDEVDEEHEEEVNKMHWGNDEQPEPYELPPDVDVDLETFESLGFVMDKVEEVEEEVEVEVEVEEDIDSTPPF